VKFSPIGSHIFYALSYDWKGAENNRTSMGNNIMVHTVVETEVFKKKA
jgi:hypothetical protein